MTENFDQFFQKITLESISLEKLSPDDYEIFEDFVSADDMANGMYISDFVVNPDNRGNGVGTSEITRAVRFADNVGSYIFLHANPYDTESNVWEDAQKRLINFYSRFGFVHVGQGWMFRQPKIHESLTVGDVVPGSGDYAPGDNRIPKILGPMIRRNSSKKTKKKKKRS